MDARKLFFILSVALFLTQAGFLRAENIYRWIDEQGNPHFTRTPPTTSAFDEVENGTIQPIEEVEDNEETEEASTDDGQPPKNELTTEEKYSKQLDKLQDQKKQACEQARKNKQYLLNKHRIRMKQTDGSIKTLTREEKLRQLDAADQAIKANCD